MKFFDLFFIIFLLSNHWVPSYSQSCNASVSGLQNWSALSWSCSGGGTAPVVDGNTYAEDVTINSLGSGDILTANVSVVIDGNLNINASGGDPAFTVPAGVTLQVTGNLNSDNNNVLYTIEGTLIVDGTFTVKNGNQFAGSGALQGGTLIVKNNNECAGTCPTITFASCCENAGTDCYPPGSPSQFCTNNSPSGLPVELLFFEAKVHQASVWLKWATIQESNNQHFIVQYSQDLFNWHNIDTLPGQGNHVGLWHYSVADTPRVNGQMYYRLQQQDIDGAMAYSPVVGVWLRANVIQPKVYPNPAVDYLQVQLSEALGNVRIYLMSTLGVVKCQQTVSTDNAGFLLVRINLINFSPGVYVLRVVTKQQTFQQKVVVK
ncbi:hypothetical protein M23134_02954 [Microscilla marina ATCC 23134]|uniref:Secretion system C-terminal sorting domain-containing protein n=1 Tax=Microscilla marina ATCC 23134 TaxID=313606 RepID=A1ZSF5_MICM2|nr:hypothetical protein M23134_02954 [Microscilla marina ATCC 23134]